MTFDEYYRRAHKTCSACLAAKAAKRRRKLSNKLRSATGLERKGAFSWLADVDADDIEIALLMWRNEQLAGSMS